MGRVNLFKGQRVDLTKDNPGLTRVIVGLGWDTNKYDGGKNFDLDACAFLLGENGKVRADSDFIFYHNLVHPSESVKHMGDNLTGEGEGDDEEIFIDLAKLPKDCDKLVFVVNVYKARERNQDFGKIKNVFIRICDNSTGEEIFRYNLSENYEGMTAMIFGEIYLRNDQWRFNAIGQANTDDNLTELAERFMH